MRFAPLFAAALLTSAAPAFAHITLTSPKPRTIEQKQGPCGETGSTRGNVVATYKPGQTITVEWDETVDHGGHYRIAFDGDGDDALAFPAATSDPAPITLADPIGDHAPGHYTQQVTLPNMNCTNCTLQLIQLMSNIGTDAPPYTYYYQCADIVLSDSAPEPMPTEPGPGPGNEAEGGCSTGAGSSTAMAALIALGMVLRRRRPGKRR